MWHGVKGSLRLVPKSFHFIVRYLGVIYIPKFLFVSGILITNYRQIAVGINVLKDCCCFSGNFNSSVKRRRMETILVYKCSANLNEILNISSFPDLNIDTQFVFPLYLSLVARSRLLYFYNSFCCHYCTDQLHYEFKILTS